MSLPQRVKPNLNAFRFEFNVNLLDELKGLYNNHLSPVLNDKNKLSLFEGGHQINEPLETDSHNFYLVSFKKFPLLWVSNDSLKTYEVFKNFFDSLNIENEIKQLIDYEKNIVMYCGFFIIGNQFNKFAWHVDFF